MPYLKNTKDSIRIYESCELKGALKQQGYVFDDRGFWYKLTSAIENIGAEYQFLQKLDVDLLLPDTISIEEEDMRLIGMTAQEVAEKAAADPMAGLSLMKKWSAINRWFAPPSVPARETIF